ncbi:hypothetical protein HK100_006199 [Physocladia obscura]|uniref:Uncharacterized protein n=1 Tax=Physocladia obscura TaxID=109957 RepID=A0AAD5XCS4_9FUNG|nr:hypothetical protein HK100_006199 [Physocladia obscura]
MDKLARDDFSFVLLGPQMHVEAGGEWYLRSAGSLTGQAGVLPSLATIAAINPAAVNGDPNTAASGNLTILVGNSTGRNVTITSTTASALASTSTTSSSASSTTSSTTSSSSTGLPCLSLVHFINSVNLTLLTAQMPPGSSQSKLLESLRMRRNEAYVKPNTFPPPNTSTFSKGNGGSGIAHQYSKIEMDEMKPIVRNPSFDNPFKGSVAAAAYNPQFQQNNYMYQQQQQQSFVAYGHPPQSTVSYVPITQQSGPSQQWK